VSEALLPAGLLAIMQCPLCGGELTERADPPALVCEVEQIAFPVEDGIPVMLEDAAQKLDD